MDCFIKKIWQSKGEGTHNYFVRFGKGKFESRAILNLQKGKKIKLKGSFEWANDFAILASELDESLRFSGVILAKEELPELSEFPNKKKAGILEYEIQNLNSRQINEIKDKVYSLLLDAESLDGKLKLKTKKRLPKPGKSGEGKVDDKFCQLETDLEFWTKIQEAFMLPECKKCKIKHTYVINGIVMPAGEKDPEKLRILAKRKGSIIRYLEIDKQASQEEKYFEV